MDILCPQCQSVLRQQPGRWRCDNNHCFDTAKQGYTNLLLVQNKRSRAPGDDAVMVESRTRFLNAGLYQPIADALNQQLLSQLTNNDSALSIIDAGCGEGYYTERLQQAMRDRQQPCDIVGIDISKFAVRAAARRSKACRWFVANSSRLPVADGSADIVLSLFSPLPSKEFARVCTPQGLLFVASTGPQHLIEMREQLYDKVDQQSLEPANQLQSHFQRVSQHSLTQHIDLTCAQQIEDLLSMTPHYWRASPARKQQLCQQPSMTVTLDIQLHCFKKVASTKTTPGTYEGSCEGTCEDA